MNGVCRDHMYPGVRERTAIAGTGALAVVRKMVGFCRESLTSIFGCLFGGGLDDVGDATKCSHWSLTKQADLLYLDSCWHGITKSLASGNLGNMACVWKSQNKNWSFQRKRYFAVFSEVILFQKACNIMKGCSQGEGT